MSRLIFPSVLPASIPYRGFVSEVRTWLQRIASWVEKNGPESSTEIGRQVAVLTAIVGTGSATQALVSNGAALPQVSDGTNAANGRVTAVATVAASAVSNVQLVSTSKIVKSGVLYPVSGGSGVAAASAVSITPTVVAGVITGFVLA